MSPSAEPASREGAVKHDGAEGWPGLNEVKAGGSVAESGPSLRLDPATLPTLLESITVPPGEERIESL